MKMQELREIARKWDVNSRIGRTEEAIIRDIQIREGNTPCYGTKDNCEENDCLWREDCLK